MQDAIIIFCMSCALLCSADTAGGVSQDDKSATRSEPSVFGAGEAAVPADTIKSIEFEGNVKFKDKVLRQRLGFEVGDHLDAFLTEGGRLTLSEVHRKVGFAFVKVTLDKDKLSQGHVFYVIEEGPRVRIAAVKFKGSKAIGAGTLKNVIKTKEKKWFAWPCYYTEESVDQDIEKLRQFYYDRGFLDYKMSAEKEFSQDKRKVHVTFIIDEGPVYRIAKMVFAGNRYFIEQQLRERLELSEEQVYLKAKAQKSASRIAELYREHGYVDAEVEQAPRFTSGADSHLVDVEFTIKEGQRFRIGRVDIVGNETMHDKVVRHVLDEYDFTPANWYNAGIAPSFPPQGGGKLEKYVQKMSLAEEVMIRPIAPADGSNDHKDVRIDVKEGMTGVIMPGVAVSSDSGLVGRVIYQQRNFDITDWPEDFGEFITMRAFRGAGQSLRVALEPGTEVSQYSVDFTDPYFRDRPVTFDLLGASWMRYRESYDEGRLKGYLRLEKRLKSLWRHSLSFRAESVEVRDLDFDAPQEIIDVRGRNSVFGTKVGIGRTTVDDRYEPTEGDTFNTGCELVTGDFTFGILSGSYVRYMTVREDVLERKTVLAGKIEAATVAGDAPPFEKFYAGGVSQFGLRGFEYRGVSTRGLQTHVPVPRYKDPIGSNWVFLANAEVTVPLIGENFAGLFFVDSGTVDTGNYRISIGAGIQIMVPQFFGPVPMRFEFATPLRRDELDETQVFSFSWGGLF